MIQRDVSKLEDINRSYEEIKIKLDIIFANAGAGMHKHLLTIYLKIFTLFILVTNPTRLLIYIPHPKDAAVCESTKGFKNSRSSNVILFVNEVFKYDSTSHYYQSHQ